MAFPSLKEIELPVLIEIEAMGGEAQYQELLPRVAAYFPQITEADLKETTTSGANKWTMRIRWASYDLKEKGELERHRGVWTITEKGMGRLRRKRLLEPQHPQVMVIHEEVKVREVRLHESMEIQLEEIGKILGKYAKKEYHEAPYTHDVIWKDMERMPRVTHAFEVQDKGNLIEALAKLKHAYDTHGSKLFLIVTGERDRRRLDELLEPHFRGTFHEIAPVTTVLNPEEVTELYKALSRYREIIGRFLAR